MPYSPADLAWRLLRAYLTKYDKEGDHTYYKCVVNKLLSLGFHLPKWLVNTYKVGWSHKVPKLKLFFREELGIRVRPRKYPGSFALVSLTWLGTTFRCLYAYGDILDWTTMHNLHNIGHHFFHPWKATVPNYPRNREEINLKNRFQETSRNLHGQREKQAISTDAFAQFCYAEGSLQAPLKEFGPTAQA